MVGEVERVVTEALTAAQMGSGTVAVFATPALVALMEAAAVTALEDALPKGRVSVGVRIDVRHTAATPVGTRVRARAELVAVDGRRLRFHVEAWDEVQSIGTADHERVLVDERRFMEQVRR
jgi:predicted thioesterase